jgi:hypothetical protein
LRLDGLNGDITAEFDFDNVNSDMTLFYDDLAGTIQISGVTDIGAVYAGGGSLWAVDMLYTGVVEIDGRLEVSPGGGNTGTVTHIDTNTVDDMIDVAGSHSCSFRCVDSHRGENRACYGWVNHSGTDIHEHVYSSD